MSPEDFQLLDDTSIDTSIIKRDYLKKYHPRGAQLNYSNQGIDFFSREKNNYHQVGNGYREFHITLSNN